MSSSKITRGILASLLILSLSSLAFADTIRLKDGSIIKGKIVSFNSGRFLIAMGEGSRRRELSFTPAEVESISFDEADASISTRRNASYEKPAERPAPPSVTQANDTSRTNTARPVLTPSNPSGSKTTAGSMAPIEWRIKVLADNTSNGWTNSGWVVKKGQRIRISGDGTVSLGRGTSSSPSGVASLEDNQKLLKNVATGALVAVIGDDNNDFIYVGAEREFTAVRDGALFLGINEGNLNDNSGSYEVKIEILP
ncbi:MAG TPA: LecA/PA-IL family lectin [Pyrinomonadaceae bacterium]|nr:LecA/PA-IL family lectin [Pyrinomonadaceae bacterium]